jgi:hypothetical protein
MIILISGSFKVQTSDFKDSALVLSFGWIIGIIFVDVICSLKKNNK